MVFPTSGKNVPKNDSTRKQRKEKRKRNDAIGAKTSLRMEPLSPIKYDARIHFGGKTIRSEYLKDLEK